MTAAAAQHVHDGDPHKIALVRAHLLKEAADFARGNFADPALIVALHRWFSAQVSDHGHDTMM